MYSACMVALQIRGVDDDVSDALAERARARGQSLQAFLLSLVQEEARRSTDLAILNRLSGRTDGSHMTWEEADQAVADHRAERDRRSERIARTARHAERGGDG